MGIPDRKTGVFQFTDTSASYEGLVKFDGTNFQGYDGAAWKQLDVVGSGSQYAVQLSDGSGGLESEDTANDIYFRCYNDITNKGAFRVGYFPNGLGTIGRRSFATGHDTIATGWTSFACGTRTNAAGSSAFACGESTDATGVCSFVSGSVSTVSGEGAGCFGSHNTVSGKYALGGGSSLSISGEYSAAFGRHNTVSGDYSCGIGQYVTSAYNNALIFGQGVASVDRCKAPAASTFSVGFNKGKTDKPDFTVAEGYACLWNANEFRWYDSGSSNYVGFEAPDLTADQIWVLPDADGTNGQVLTTAGDGTLSWEDAGGGSSTGVQYAVQMSDGSGGFEAEDTGNNLYFRLYNNSTDSGAFRAGHFPSGLGTVGVGSVAFGDSTVSSANRSFAGGVNSSATGNISFAFGSSTDATNVYAIALGRYAVASGWSSCAIGENAEAGYENSYIFGLGDGTADKLQAPSVRTFSVGFNKGSTDKPDFTVAEGYACLWNANEFRWYDSGSSNYVGFEAPALTANTIWTLPDDDGSNGDQLTTDGSGTLSWAAASDRRIKSDIRALNYGLETICALEPKRFRIHDWHVEDDHLVVDEPHRKEQIGLIAQDVYKHIPEVVHKPKDEDCETWGMKPQKLIPVLIQAIKELTERVELLERVQA